MSAVPMNQSGPFQDAASILVSNGDSPMPVIPGWKHPRPGWDRYRDEPMSNKDMSAAVLATPSYGVAVCGGFNGLAPLDIDTDDPERIAAIESVMPPCPVGKRGQNGFTLFYQSKDPAVLSRGRKFKDRDGTMICELLTNNYTLIPPTVHPGTKQPY